MEFPLELIRLMDTREFQRLRGVRQLGTANFVYPGAVHTRFDHSLGTCWLTTRLLNTLAPKMTKTERLAVLAAALLHDVTHVPFGHTLEDERRIFERHDTLARIQRYLPMGELGRALKSLNLLDEVLEISTTKGHWKNQVYAGALAADLLDYLARDNYFCGLNQRYDPRIYGLFRIKDEQLIVDAQKDGLTRPDALSEVIHLLRIRYFLSERVYFHHTKTSSGAMISRAVEDAVKQGLTLDDIAKRTDEGLLSLLERDYSGSRVVEQMLDGLRSRRFYKRVFLLSADLSHEKRVELVEDYHLNAGRRSKAEIEIAKKAKLEPQDLIIYCPALKMQLKEARLPIQIDDGPMRILEDLPVDEIGILKERHRRLWRFYVFLNPLKMQKAEKVSQICERYFNESNHLPKYRTGQLYLGW